jgi:predicted MFS family arabinose efflux permease
MKANPQRFALVVLVAVCGLAFGLAMGAAIGASLGELMRLWSPAVFVLVLAAVAFEAWRLRRKPTRSAEPLFDGDEATRRRSTRLPVIVFCGCVVGGGIAVALHAIRGSVDSTDALLILGIVIGAGLPTFVDLKRARRGN